MKTDDEVIHETFGNRTDIFTYNVYKMDWASHYCDSFLICLEPNSFVHLFHINHTSIKHLKFEPIHIKKISFGYYLPFYLSLSCLLSGLFSILFSKTMLLNFKINITGYNFLILLGFAYVLFFFLLTKLFYLRRIRILTSFHTSYSFFYPEFPTTHKSFSALKAKEFEKTF